MKPDGIKDFWEAFAAQRAGEWTQALSRLIQFKTVSGSSDPAAERIYLDQIAEGMAYLEELGRSLGFVTRNFDNRALVIEQPGKGGAPVLGFPIHLDVVPAGEGWTHPPFGGEVKGGALWGRGTQDDKGPIIEAIYALRGAVDHARQEGRSLDKTIQWVADFFCVLCWSTGIPRPSSITVTELSWWMTTSTSAFMPGSSNPSEF